MHLKWSPCCKLVRLDCCTQPKCRCVLQFILTVELVRVGTFAMLPNASLTPRSLIPLEGDVSEREELSKISGLMIYVCHAHHLCTPCLWRKDLSAPPSIALKYMPSASSQRTGWDSCLCSIVSL